MLFSALDLYLESGIVSRFIALQASGWQSQRARRFALFGVRFGINVLVPVFRFNSAAHLHKSVVSLLSFAQCSLDWWLVLYRV